ncbi:MAG: NADH-quinone oxidoreductase subunit L [Candidatus Omnitrophota bacterium]
MEKNLILFIIFLPLLGAFLLPLVGCFSRAWRQILALAFVAAPLFFSLRLVPLVTAGRSLNINGYFLADGLAVFMAVSSSLISAVIIFYSFGYISRYENQNEYYCMVVLFLGAMMGLVFSANLLLIYIFWEITAVASWRLIGFFRDPQFVLKADKAFLITAFGALAMLLGFLCIYQQTGSFDLAVIKQTLKIFPLSNLAAALILMGILSKSATLPFHSWLPDAGVAPSPVTALLHAAILVKIGVYVFARLFMINFQIAELWHTVVPVIAAASAIVSAGAAFWETDLKRIIAYSTISQIGFIFFGLAIGNEIAAAGGLLYILIHGLAKSGLFLCAGIIEQNTKTKDITKLGGLMQTMPVTAFSFLFCAFSVMGIPPFGGFFSKYLIFSGAVAAKQLGIGLVFLFGAFFTILYLFRVFNLVFLGEPRFPRAKEGSAVMVISVAILAALSLLSGIFIYYPAKFMQITVWQMPGMLKW